MQKNHNNHIFMPEDHMDKLYNSKNPLVSFVHRQRLDAIVDSMPRHNGLKILDAGCGEGHLISKLHEKNPSNNYYGIDTTEVAIEKAKKRCFFAEFSMMDLNNIHFEDGFFDVVITTEVLEHVYDYKLAISEMKRVLVKNGFLIVTFPNEFLWTVSRFILGRRPIKVPDHVNSFTPEIMKSAVNLELIDQKNLPFYLAFFCSLGSLMKFKKQ